MAMTYLQIQDAVLADGFGEGKRSDAKQWIQSRHADVWYAEEWVFRYGTDTSITVTADSQTVTGTPTDLGIVLGLWNADGDPLVPYTDVRAFLDRYNASVADPGKPEAFCVVGSSVLVGPTSSETSSGYLMAYEKNKPSLSADADTTGLPEGYDLMLVFGAKADGFALTNVPLADGFRTLFNEKLDSMRRNFRAGSRVTGEQSPAYRP